MTIDDVYVPLQQHLEHFRPIAATGVIYVMKRAREYGFEYNHPEWANMGQGS